MREKRNRMRSGLLCFVCTLLLVLQSAQPAAAAETGVTNQVSFVAVGDDLIHSQVYKSAKKGKKYDFSSLFANVRQDVESADLAAINQETILVDKNYSGYPCFGSPKSLANAITDAGFDIVTHATNHTMDRGTNAIKGTLKYWNEKFPQMHVLGIHNSSEDASKVTIVEKNGIRIAMLNYTYGLNGIKVPSGKKYVVDLLGNTSKIKKDIKAAKQNSDFIIVFAHWGTEYQYKPDSYQKKMANFFADQDVDLLVGTHPHVLEPVRYVKGKSGHRMLTYYSLGNFVSCQNKPDRLLGGMARVTIEKGKYDTYVKSYDLEPLVTHIGKGKKSFTVYKLRDYTSKLAKSNAIHSMSSQKFTVSSLKSLYKKITGRKL